MDAQRPRGRVGDIIVFPEGNTQRSAGVAKIVEVLGGDGEAPFRVLWADGSESIIYPSSASTILRS